MKNYSMGIISYSQRDLKEAVLKLFMDKCLYKKNRTVKEMTCFFGAGVWPQHVPSVVDYISSRSEFLTSYTPYHAKIS